MEKLNIGVIGAGRIGKVHTETIVQSVPRAKLIAIADIDFESARDLASKFGIENVSDDYKSIICNPKVDAVIICSPTDTHAQYIIEAAKAGKHIFCEKPIDLDLKTIQKAIKIVEESGVKMMIGFNRRFDPNFAKVKQMVVDDKIGDPHIIKITSRDPEPPPAEYIEVSGGMFLDMTIHDFDMARFISGSEIEEVYVSANVLVDSAIGKAGDVDTAVISLKFENGAIGVIDNSRRAVYGYDQRVEVFGSKGMVNVDNNTPDNHSYYYEKGVIASQPLNFFMDRYTQAYAAEIREFCAAILGESEITVGGFDGLVAVAIGLAAKKSVKEKRPVRISEIMKVLN